MSTQSSCVKFSQQPEVSGAIDVILSIRISSIISHIRMAAAM